MTDSISSSTFTSRGSAQFNWHSCTVASLKVPAITVYEVPTKVPDTESFPQHNITGLSLALHLLFCSVRKSLFGGRKKNTNIHTRKQQIHRKMS